MRTTMSKAAMASRLIELGSDRAFNTLRKYPAELLESMLAAAIVAEPEMVALFENEPVLASTVAAPYVPTDAEIMRPSTLTPAPIVEPAKERRTIGEWLHLAFSPFLLIRTVFGIA